MAPIPKSLHFAVVWDMWFWKPKGEGQGSSWDFSREWEFDMTPQGTEPYEIVRQSHRIITNVASPPRLHIEYSAICKFVQSFIPQFKFKTRLYCTGGASNDRNSVACAWGVVVTDLVWATR